MGWDAIEQNKKGRCEEREEEEKTSKPLLDLPTLDDLVPSELFGSMPGMICKQIHLLAWTNRRCL